MNLIHPLTDDYVVCYRIKQELGHIKLRLWEPALSNSYQTPGEQPFLYAANFSFRHLDDAEAFLRDHLLVNGAIEVPDSDFPDEGEVAILPFPTWGLAP